MKFSRFKSKIFISFLKSSQDPGDEAAAGFHRYLQCRQATRNLATLDIPVVTIVADLECIVSSCTVALECIVSSCTVAHPESGRSSVVRFRYAFSKTTVFGNRS